MFLGSDSSVLLIFGEVRCMILFGGMDCLYASTMVECIVVRL